MQNTKIMKSLKSFLKIFFFIEKKNKKNYKKKKHTPSCCFTMFYKKISIQYKKVYIDVI